MSDSLPIAEISMSVQFEKTESQASYELESSGGISNALGSDAAAPEEMQASNENPGGVIEDTQNPPKVGTDETNPGLEPEQNPAPVGSAPPPPAVLDEPVSQEAASTAEAQHNAENVETILASHSESEATVMPETEFSQQASHVKEEQQQVGKTATWLQQQQDLFNEEVASVGQLSAEEEQKGWPKPAEHPAVIQQQLVTEAQPEEQPETDSLEEQHAPLAAAEEKLATETNVKPAEPEPVTPAPSEGTSTCYVTKIAGDCEEVDDHKYEIIHVWVGM